MAIENHNPDSQCVECCKTNERLNLFLDQLEGLLSKVSDPSAVDDMPPMLKMVFKMIGKQ